MEEVDFDTSLRFEEIRSWSVDIMKECGIYGDQAQDVVVHYLQKYYPNRFQIYLGAKDDGLDSHLDSVGSLYGIQSRIAKTLKSIAAGEREQLELDWYIHRALEIDMPQKLILHVYSEIDRVFPEYSVRAYGIFETYLQNYSPSFLKYYLDKEAPLSHARNMEVIDIMICHFWICEWLKEEDEGIRKRRDTDYDIRQFMKFPPNMIPSMDQGKRKKSISHRFKIIDGGKS